MPPSSPSTLPLADITLHIHDILLTSNLDIDPETTTFLTSEVTSNLPSSLSSLSALSSYLKSHLEDLCGISPPEASKLCTSLWDVLLDVCEDINTDAPAVKDQSDLHTPPPNPKPLDSTCELCARPMPLTFHHLVPKRVQPLLLKRSIITKSDCNRGGWLCRPCHSAVHRLISHEELGRNYDTIEKLEEHEAIRKWVTYAEKQRVVGLDHAVKGLKYGRR